MISTVLSALIALVCELEKLVEFMSIGTLLAYTIVSASVIILRYKPSVVTYTNTISIDREIGLAPENGETTSNNVSCEKFVTSLFESFRCCLLFFPLCEFFIFCFVL